MKLPPIPNTLDPEVARWARDFSVAMDAEARRSIQKGTATDSVLLVSPNGSVYSVAVTDAGALTATLVLG